MDFESLRGDRKKLAALGAAVLALLIFIVWWSRPLSPIQVLEKIDKVGFDSPKLQSLCTADGYALLKWLNDQSKSQANTATKYGEPIYSGDSCEVPADFTDAKGQLRCKIRLLNQGGWKFHDVYLDEFNGKKLDLWGSYAKDHPIRTAIWLNWEDMVTMFFKGFAMGAAAGS